MISYEEFLQEWIGLNRWQDETGKFHSEPMTRENYYKLHMNGISPRPFYDALVKIWKEKDERNR